MSIVTIKNTDCKLNILSSVAEISGGEVNIIDPKNVKDEFGMILNGKIIATNVVAKLVLHKSMYFKDCLDRSKIKNVITSNVGNVTENTEITFEFGFKESI